MSSITVEQIDGSEPPFEAWRDGKPSLPAEAAAVAERMISEGERVGLTPEGPYFEASWDTLEAAAALLTEMFPWAYIIGEPPLDHYYERPPGVF